MLVAAFRTHVGGNASSLQTLHPKPQDTQLYIIISAFHRSNHWSSVQTGIIMAQWMQYTIFLTAFLRVWSAPQTSRRREFAEAQVLAYKTILKFILIILFQNSSLSNTIYIRPIAASLLTPNSDVIHKIGI